MACNAMQNATGSAGSGFRGLKTLAVAPIGKLAILEAWGPVRDRLAARELEGLRVAGWWMEEDSEWRRVDGGWWMEAGSLTRSTL